MYITSLWSEHEKQTTEAEKVREGREPAGTLLCPTQPFLTSRCWTRHVRQRSPQQAPWPRSSRVFWLWSGPPSCCSSRSSPGPGNACWRIGPSWILVPLKESRSKAFKMIVLDCRGPSWKVSTILEMVKNKKSGLNYISGLWGLLYPKTILCSTSSEILHFWLDIPNWTNKLFSFCSQQGYSRWVMNVSSRHFSFSASAPRLWILFSTRGEAAPAMVHFHQIANSLFIHSFFQFGETWEAVGNYKQCSIACLLWIQKDSF